MASTSNFETTVTDPMEKLHALVVWVKDKKASVVSADSIRAADRMEGKVTTVKWKSSKYQAEIIKIDSDKTRLDVMLDQYVNEMESRRQIPQKSILAAKRKVLKSVNNDIIPIESLNNLWSSKNVQECKKKSNKDCASTDKLVGNCHRRSAEAREQIPTTNKENIFRPYEEVQSRFSNNSVNTTGLYQSYSSDLQEPNGNCAPVDDYYTSTLNSLATCAPSSKNDYIYHPHEQRMNELNYFTSQQFGSFNRSSQLIPIFSEQCNGPSTLAGISQATQNNSKKKTGSPEKYNVGSALLQAADILESNIHNQTDDEMDNQLHSADASCSFELQNLAPSACCKYSAFFQDVTSQTVESFKAMLSLMENSLHSTEDEIVNRKRDSLVPELKIETEQKKVELIPGMGVFVSEGQKTTIELIGGNNPGKVIRAILTSLYTPKELLQYTALGLRNSNGLPLEVLQVIKAYVIKKCKGAVVDNNFIHAKIRSKLATNRRQLNKCTVLQPKNPKKSNTSYKFPQNLAE